MQTVGAAPRLLAGDVSQAARATVCRFQRVYRGVIRSRLVSESPVRSAEMANGPPGQEAFVGSFDAYVQRGGPALARTAFLLTGDRQLAEDLVQTVLAK